MSDLTFQERVFLALLPMDPRIRNVPTDQADAVAQAITDDYCSKHGHRFESNSDQLELFSKCVRCDRFRGCL